MRWIDVEVRCCLGIKQQLIAELIETREKFENEIFHPELPEMQLCFGDK